MRKAVLFIVIPLFITSISGQLITAKGQDKGPFPGTTENPYRIPRADSPIRIDGKLDEEAWRSALTVELNYEIMPGENVPPPVRTECLFIYDDSYFYVAFKSYDSDPAAIRANLTDRDGAFSDDYVGIIVDTYNDERRGYQFLVNPLGVQMDSTRSEVGDDDDEDFSWDAIWYSAGNINTDGYVVEIAVPFTSLRFPRSNEGLTWGIGPIRNYPRSQRHQIASMPIDRNRNTILGQITKVRGFEGVLPGKDIEFDPTFTATRTDGRENFPFSPMEERNSKSDLGLTGRWGVTPNMTLTGTLNPDFSQVEADVAQLDINEQFALFYPERRPFFLEGTDFFETGAPAVHTRTIADPSWGMKLTGKEGANAMGFFVARDELTNLLFPGAQESRSTSLDMKSTAAVARFRRDIGKNSTIGALVTDREGDDYFNRLLLLDGHFRLTSKDTFAVQIGNSVTQYPEHVAAEYDQPTGSFDGLGVAVGYEHETRDYWFSASYLDLDADVRLDLGFLPQVDIREEGIDVGYQWWGESEDWFTRIEVSAGWFKSEEKDGTPIVEEYELGCEFEGPLQSYFEFNLGWGDRVFNSVEFKQQYQSLYFQAIPTGKMFFGIYAGRSDRIDYSHTRAGLQYNVNPELRYDFGKHLHLEFDHTYQKFDVEGGRLFLANLSQLRLVYQFNVRTFIRYIMQFTDIRRNTASYSFEVDAITRQLFNQLLFSYKINPQTVLFLGYSDNHFGDQSIDLTQSDRTFFMKIGYAWQL